MNEIVENEILTPEMMHVVIGAIKELPYEKLAVIGIGYLVYTALTECNIKAVYKDFELSISPATKK